MSMTWQERAFLATQGSQFGAILACAMGREIDPPCFVGKASVTSDGFVMCGFRKRNGDHEHGAFVGSMGDLQNNVAGLGKHLGLDPAERLALDALVRSWVGADWRPGGTR